MIIQPLLGILIRGYVNPYQSLWGYDHPLAYGKQWEFTLNSHIRFHQKSFFNLSVPPLVSIHPPVQKTLEVQVLSILPVT